MAVSRRTFAIRYVFAACVILFLVSSFRIWNVTDHLPRPNSPLSEYVPAIPWKLRPQQPSQPQERRGIPKKIWYKLGPRGLNSDAHERTGSCIMQNPEYQVTFLTDESADYFVIDKFADHPDIVEAYLALNVPILKADLLRYLLLFAEGGVWFDQDVSCDGIPIDNWVPEEFSEDAKLVVGWEDDMDRDYSFPRQFATWTILASKGAERLMDVVNDTMQAIRELAEEKGVPLAELTMDMVGQDKVIELTGPRRFKTSIIKSLKRSLNWKIRWTEYHEIVKPMMVGDVLILPGISFSAAVNEYADEDQDSLGPPLVSHHYAGSWRNEKGGETLKDGGEDEGGDDDDEYE